MPIVRVFSRLFGRTAAPSPTQSANSEGGFTPIARFVLAARIPTIGIAFALLAASLLLPVKPSFFPNSDRNQFVVDISLPETTPIYRTNEVAQHVEQMVRRLSDTTWQDGQWQAVVDDDGQPVQRLNTMAVYVGAGGPRFYTGLDPKPGGPYYALIMINATDREYVQQYVADIRRAAWQGAGDVGEEDYVRPVSGARVVPHQLVMGTPVPSPIMYRIMGPGLRMKQCCVNRARS